MHTRGIQVGAMCVLHSDPSVPRPSMEELVWRTATGKRNMSLQARVTLATGPLHILQAHRLFRFSCEALPHLLWVHFLAPSLKALSKHSCANGQSKLMPSPARWDPGCPCHLRTFGIPSRVGAAVWPPVACKTSRLVRVLSKLRAAKVR